MIWFHLIVHLIPAGGADLLNLGRGSCMPLAEVEGRWRILTQAAVNAEKRDDLAIRTARRCDVDVWDVLHLIQRPNAAIHVVSSGVSADRQYRVALPELPFGFFFGQWKRDGRVLTGKGARSNDHFVASRISVAAGQCECGQKRQDRSHVHETEDNRLPVTGRLWF